MAVADWAWESELGTMLTSAQVRELRGGVPLPRVEEQLRKRQLIALEDRAGRNC